MGRPFSKMKTDPLKVINFKHEPWSFSTMPYKLYFTVKGTAELSGEKCKRLVTELEKKLRDFSHKFDDRISCSCSELSEFFCYRAAINQINGGWHSFSIHSSFGSKNEDVRRKDLGRVTSLLNQELRKWRFAHYTTSLQVISIEPK